MKSAAAIPRPIITIPRHMARLGKNKEQLAFIEEEEEEEGRVLSVCHGERNEWIEVRYLSGGLILSGVFAAVVSDLL